MADLDLQQVVDYRLHPWADQYLIIRADLYPSDDGAMLDDDETGENSLLDDNFEGNKTASPMFQAMNRFMTPTGVRIVPLPALNFAINQLLDRLSWGIPIPQQPVTKKHIPKNERNQQICLRFAAGNRLEAIANEYNISIQRVAQLIHRWC